MAYLRYTTKLLSGKTSRYHVIGDPTHLSNIGIASVPYNKVREWFSRCSRDEFRKNIEAFLKVSGEELESLVEDLYAEYGVGEWRAPFDFELEYKKRLEKRK